MTIDGHTDMVPDAGPRRRPRAVVWALKLAEIASVAMFAALFLTFVAQVYWRYVLVDPLVWTLEIAGILFVTISLFTAATQMPFREHVSLDLLIDLAPRGLRRVLLTLSLILFAVPMALTLPDTVAALDWMYRERTFAIGFNLGHLFVLMIGFVVAMILRALWGIWTLWRRPSSDPRDG